MTSGHFTIERAVVDYVRNFEVARAKIVGHAVALPRESVAVVIANAIDAAMARFDILMAMAQAAPHTQALPGLTRVQAEQHARQHAYAAAELRGWL